jgi:hypothetical protein
MKDCSKCGATLPATTEFFHQRRTGTRRFRTACRECHKAYCRERYLADHELHLADCARYRETHREKMKDYFDRRYKRFADNLQILKRTQGCSTCGRKDGKLDYHHVDKATKLFNIAGMHNCSLESFIDEISKCTLLCSPCHVSGHCKDQPRGFHGRYARVS